MEESGTLPIFEKHNNDRSDLAGTESYRMTPFSFSFPEVLGKPHSTILNSPLLKDYTTSTLPEIKRLLKLYNNRMPITSRMTFFGGVQGDKFEPEYTQQRLDLTGRFVSGTGNGGIFIMPPEIDLADQRLQNEAGGEIESIENGEVSETHFGLAPNVPLTPLGNLAIVVTVVVLPDL